MGNIISNGRLKWVKALLNGRLFNMVVCPKIKWH